MSNNGSVSSTFPQTPGLDQDLGSVGILLENSGGVDESQQINFNDLYTPNETKSATPELSFSPLPTGGGDSGELTPVSVSSEFEYHHPPDSEGINLLESSSKEETKSQSSTLSSSNIYGGLYEDVIKQKLDNNLGSLEGEEEEDEEEKTITTISMAQRESIVGFFSEAQSKNFADDDMDVSDK